MSGGLYSVEAEDSNRALDLSQVEPYGDTINDDKAQLGFTLPVPKRVEAEEAAKLLLKKMGLQNPVVVFSGELAEGFTFFNCYGSCAHAVDCSNIYVPRIESTIWDMEETNEFIRTHIGRKLVVLGASIGTNTYTVGIDTVVNIKGLAGHYGLEHYDMIDARNLGSQVPNEGPTARGIEMSAGALLVSQTVTQKDVHIKNVTELIELVEAEGLRNRVIIVCSGPRISHELAKELGFDAGFGANTFADDVASFICQEIVRRKEIAEGK